MKKLITLLAVLAASCGGAADQAGPTTPAGDEPAPSGAEAAPADAATGPAWADLDREGRLALMRGEVMPRLGGLFREMDAEEFSTFTCAACHGDDFQAVDFAMPNGVYPLVPAEIPAMFESEDAELAAAAQFMVGRILPEMVSILRVAEYDPATGQGFGCLRCHATAE
jgi:hypothetical protein